MLWYQSVPVWFQRLFPALVWEIPGKSSKDVYLTFDDGPHPAVTSFVLGELKRYGFKATFFVVGENARNHPIIIRDLEQNGHKTGNHTMRHLKGWKTDVETYVRDIQECSRYAGGDLFRPPYGRIRFAQIARIRSEYRIIMWSLLSLDYMTTLNRKRALSALKRKTRNGSIVVFHDSVKAEANLRFLLPPYLEYLHQKGYTCKTL